MSDCPEKDYGGPGFMRLLNEKVRKNRIPLNGMIELTRRCNFRCIHCYLGDKKTTGINHNLELDTRQWIDVIDQFVKCGCLFLIITGGEPLLREDFPDIYTYARKKGLLITVFTNGTTINPDLIDLFLHLPPNSIEVTIYGASDATYEKVTGVRAGYQKFLKGMNLLLNLETKLHLKTVLMTHNRHEYRQMLEMAKGWGIRDFRSDPVLFPTFIGNRKPLDFRIPAEEAVSLEFLNDDLCEKFAKHFHKMKNRKASNEAIPCGAGISGFHIDAFGNLHPCLMLNSIQYSVLKDGFEFCWKHFIPQFRENRTEASLSCRECDIKTICGYCPGLFELENGSLYDITEYICSLGQSRFNYAKEQEKKL